MKKKRIVSIDAARGVAVVLAMLSHCFVQFGLANPVSPLTRLATPTFVVLLGAMLFIVYLRRLSDGATPSQVRRRLAERAILCYVLFALITLAAFVTGKIGARETLEAVAYLSNGRFGTILKLYAVLFLVLAAILPLLARYGGAALAAVAVAGWAVKIVLAASGMPTIYLLDFLFGYAEGGFGPSIAPSFAFIAFGFWIGEMLSGQRSTLLPGLVVAMALLGLWITIGQVSYAEIKALVDWTKRSGDHPDYYLFSIVGSALVIWLCHLLSRIPSLVGGLCFLGQQTLFIYGFGNIMLNIVPTYDGGSLIISLSLIALFLGTLIAISVDRIRPRSLIGRALNPLPGRVLAIYGSAVARILDRAIPQTAARPDGVISAP